MTRIDKNHPRSHDNSINIDTLFFPFWHKLLISFELD